MIESKIKGAKSGNPKGFLLDLVIYLSVMFLVRELYFSQVNFIMNALFYSSTTLVVATWRMKARGVTWSDLGLFKPKSLTKILLLSGLILLLTIASIMIFEIIKDHLPITIAPDTSTESAVSRFGNLKDNWPLFFSIIFFVLIESLLEELLDRGFLMNWLEGLFSKTSLATVLAILGQAAIFGFRHLPSHGASGAITVGIIALVMGSVYMLSGRNLWPLIIAHCILNTMSMLDRV